MSIFRGKFKTSLDTDTADLLCTYDICYNPVSTASVLCIQTLRDNMHFSEVKVVKLHS